MSRLVVARHYRSRVNLELELESETDLDPANERLVACNPAPDDHQARPDFWIAPALVDLQINGYAGVDFQNDTTEAHHLLKACGALLRDGCGLFLLTLITDEWPRMLHRLARLKSIRDKHVILRNTIAGWHLEGPFLSDQPGFHGAHHPGFMLDPMSEHLRAIKTITAEDPVLLTIAPERCGANDFIKAAIKVGFTVCLGHTDGSCQQLDAAIKAGAVAITHLGNAVPQHLHRHDNVLWRMLDSEGIAASLIPDGIHLPAGVLRSIWKIMGPERLFFTTDAMAAAGAPPGRYHIGHLELEVGEDKVVRQPGSLNFAGSALEPSRGVQRASEMLRIPWQEAWHAFSEMPLRILNQSQTSSRKPCVNPACCLIPFSEPFDPGKIKTVYRSPNIPFV